MDLKEAAKVTQAMAKPIISLDLGENYYDPRDFVEATVYGEELGFKRLWFGDHFMPWFHTSDRSSFVWSVMASALERTKKVQLGPLVTTPIGARYHPALVAQASATLDNMYPGRFLVSVGAGEAVNEVPFWNDRWPDWQERMDRLCEGLTLMEKLWTAPRHFSFKGKYFSSDFYYMYTKPRTRLEMYFSAVGPKAAYRAGRYGDHLVTLSPWNNAERIRDVILPEFRKGQKDAKKKAGGLVVHLDFAFKSHAQVLKDSRHELTPFVKNSVDIRTPIALENATRTLTAKRLSKFIHSCKNWDDLIKVLDEYIEVGANEIILFTPPNKKEMEAAARNVLSVF
ncbi:MAG: LLM class flavin-dependent oxidoreductase [Nitrososphaerota archaeon]|nr:LLM class flavin-dependent oxidoreductase [Nitrososphaerota archaeon]